MKRIILPLLLLLSACTTPAPPPPVVTNECHPPTEITRKYDDLPQIVASTQPTRVSQEQGLQIWRKDVTQYNNLNADHSKLIDWIHAYCK